MRYDVAIIGTGPAGISAALNLKLYNKKIIWFGSVGLSKKVEKSEKIANYPGFPMENGKKLNEMFKQQIEKAGLEITDKIVTSITVSGQGFMILGGNEIYEADKVLLATGIATARSMPGEDELLGKGVSYCATCDGFLYKKKKVAIFCGAKRYEHEVQYLAELAEKVYLYAAYPDCDIDLPNVECLASPINAIKGRERVESVHTKEGESYEVDGIFILRTSLAPTTLLRQLEVDGNHIAVNRKMETNIPGCYAAGDCTGRPYQIAKAVGEGNIAAHSIIEN